MKTLNRATKKSLLKACLEGGHCPESNYEATELIPNYHYGEPDMVDIGNGNLEEAIDIVLECKRECRNHGWLIECDNHRVADNWGENNVYDKGEY